MQTTHPTQFRRAGLAAALALALVASVASQDITLPQQKGSVHFAVLGDTGSGSSPQYKIGQVLTAARAKFPFDFALMLGDNIYGGDSQRDFEDKFEAPYQPLLSAGVKFYAALGNHDDPTNQMLYKPFNMNGERYYTFKPGLNSNVRFFGLDSNYMDEKQVAWLEKELAASTSEWKIAFFHHPLYSSGGTHGSDLPLRAKLEPLFVKYGVDVVFSGHDHFYERIKPQKGIQYFVSGGAGKLRSGDIKRTDLTEKGFDTGYHFMLVEVAGDNMYFQVISDQGKTVDSGVVARRPVVAPSR
jgi:3',5'-cyclic AMP phosphodiesterase CpdA